VTLAGIVRALVVHALSEEGRQAGTLPDQPPELLASATWMAARHGLEGELVDPAAGRAQPGAQVAAALLDMLTPALEQAGDLQRVTLGVQRLVRDGSAAERQRRAFRKGGLAAALDLSEM
jgi:carboxylate-amine ligase